MEYLLNNASVGQNLVVKQINIKNVEKLRRLQELGFVCGQKIVLVAMPTKHVRLLLIRGSIVALDSQICSKVVVCG